MRRLFVLILVCLTLLSPVIPPRAGHAQESDPLDNQVEWLLARMSTAEKVGQLFLVAFSGNDVGPDSDIADLILNDHVGGVVLSAANGNIVNEGDTPGAVVSMTNQLQALSYASTQPRENIEPDIATPTPTGSFVPLFIAVQHEGDAYPFTSLINGFTPLPNNMAIGATWKTEQARAMGRIVGQELAAVGINMLLGPSLDVLDTPRPTGRGILGTRTFGGDPFWVGEMGQAYIIGVHEGSRRDPEDAQEHGRIAVVAKHLPGYGSSDRQVNEEVATVQKPLETLKQNELLPFFAVAQPEDSLARTDALMTAHIRYQGFQGNIYLQTKPISLDQDAMGAVLALPQLAAWRQQGGVIVSDALGVRAVQHFFDRSLQEFNGKLIAREAFAAGNDLLYLAEYGLYGKSTWKDQLANIKDAILLFRNRYEQDQLFRERVDASVRRILRLKLQLYPQFSLEAVQVDPAARSDLVGHGRDQVFQVAKDAITLIAPERANFILDRPDSDEKIVIFGDDRQLPESCPAPRCQPQSDYIARGALTDTILRLYGPGEGAIGDVDPANVQSFTFSQLLDYLASPQAPPPPTPAEGETPTPTPLPLVQAALEQADWVVFAMLDVRLDNSGTAVSNAVKQFLDQRGDLTQDKRVVVLAFNSPYYLDTTEVSKLDAYYGVYSRVEPFIEAAVRALFGETEFIDRGRSPVTIEGTNYLLREKTAPDPSQTIDLVIYAIDGITVTQTLESTPQPTPENQPKVGDTLTLRTGVILDHNGHPVPDGTPVDFWFTYSPTEGGLPSFKQVTTKDGIAETEFKWEQAEPLEIKVSSGDAQISKVIRLAPDKPVELFTPTPPPTPTPTDTPTPTPTSTPTPTPTSTLTPTPTFTPTPTPQRGGSSQGAGPRVDGRDLVLVVMAMVLIGGTGFVVGRNDGGSTVTGMRLFLWSWILGMVGYILYGLGALKALEGIGAWGALLTGIIGGLLPLILYATVGRLLRKLRQWSET